ncbi:MAG TPA: hypothetical protein VKE98_06515 [Gemmataceae bacterium]|nr:hypothetical protein [Gemmataceae bacterium]
MTPWRAAAQPPARDNDAPIDKRPVRSLPPSKPRTGPASPRRSVCAPSDDVYMVTQTA